MKYIKVDFKAVKRSKFRGLSHGATAVGKNADVTDGMLAFFNKLFKGQYYIIYD